MYRIVRAGDCGTARRCTGKRRDCADDEVIDDRTRSKTHCHNAAGQAWAIGEPLDCGGDRRDIAEPDTEATDNAISQIEPKRPECGRADTRQQVSRAPQYDTDQRDSARPRLVLPSPADHRAQADEKDSARE